MKKSEKNITFLFTFCWFCGIISLWATKKLSIRVESMQLLPALNMPSQFDFSKRSLEFLNRVMIVAAQLICMPNIMMKTETSKPILIF